MARHIGVEHGGGLARAQVTWRLAGGRSPRCRHPPGRLTPRATSTRPRSGCIRSRGACRRMGRVFRVYTKLDETCPRQRLVVVEKSEPVYMASVSQLWSRIALLSLVAFSCSGARLFPAASFTLSATTFSRFVSRSVLRNRMHWSHVVLVGCAVIPKGVAEAPGLRDDYP